MVVSHSTLSTIGLSLQAILLITVQAFTCVSYLFIAVSSMSKNSSVSAALLSILYTAKIKQKF